MDKPLKSVAHSCLPAVDKLNLSRKRAAAIRLQVTSRAYRSSLLAVDMECLRCMQLSRRETHEPAQLDVAHLHHVLVDRLRRHDAPHVADPRSCLSATAT